MKSYKFDTHVHTSETSYCGQVDGRQGVRLYKEAGYAGIVVTDHYYKEYFESLCDMNWQDKIDIFLTGYKNAYDEGKSLGINVLLGIELRFYDSCNDYLVYGIDEEFLKENKELYSLGLEKFKAFIRDKGLLIFQAHPFRINMTPAEPALLDGVEVFNGNPRHDSRNSVAYSFAEDNGLRMLSGSDFHQVEDLARGGILLPENISTSAELVKLIINNQIIRLLP